MNVISPSIPCSETIQSCSCSNFIGRSHEAQEVLSELVRRPHRYADEVDIEILELFMGNPIAHRICPAGKLLLNRIRDEFDSILWGILGVGVAVKTDQCDTAMPCLEGCGVVEIEKPFQTIHNPFVTEIGEFIDEQNILMTCGILAIGVDKIGC